MVLYDSLALRYDEVFPLNPATIPFVEAHAPSRNAAPGQAAPRRILDLGSATGSLALEFATRGWEALGIELNGTMTGIARQKAAAYRLAGGFHGCPNGSPPNSRLHSRPSGEVHFEKGDMRNVKKIAQQIFGGTAGGTAGGAHGSIGGAHGSIGRVAGRAAGGAHGSIGRVAGGAHGIPIERSIEAALCLGNTLPHLAPQDVQGLCADVGSLLAPAAPFIVQTLNYSHPEIGPGFQFPDIRIPGLVFSRHYQADGSEQDASESKHYTSESKQAAGESLTFCTALAMDTTTQSDRTILYPLRPAALVHIARQTGYTDIAFFSDWEGHSFDPSRDRYMIAVLTAPL